MTCESRVWECFSGSVPTLEPGCGGSSDVIFAAHGDRPTHAARSHPTPSEGAEVLRHRGSGRVAHLPPYSPDLNPIEFWWADIKPASQARHRLRTRSARRDPVAEDATQPSESCRVVSSRSGSAQVIAGVVGGRRWGRQDSVRPSNLSSLPVPLSLFLDVIGPGSLRYEKLHSRGGNSIPGCGSTHRVKASKARGEHDSIYCADAERIEKQDLRSCLFTDKYLALTVSTAPGSLKCVSPLRCSA